MVYDEGTKALAVQMYRDGATDDEIGAATGAGRTSIHSWARAAGLPLRGIRRHGYSSEVRELAVAMYAKGLPMVDIRIACRGVGSYAIRKWVRAAGGRVRGMGGQRVRRA
jgi:uncharacterized protein YjcR